MSDLISRQDAIDALKSHEDYKGYLHGDFETILEALPSSQPDQILYANMSDAEFEKWLHEHGICNPNIHESIPCDAVPMLIDIAISELQFAQPEIIRCKDCIYFDKYSDCIEMYQWDGFCADWARNTYENWYCSRAERRTDETQNT